MSAFLRNHWQALTRFVADGVCRSPTTPTPRNGSGNRSRSGAKKNWLFVSNEDGGTWAVDLLSEFQSCRLQQLNPIRYLTEIMPRLIAEDTDPLRLTQAIAELRRSASDAEERHAGIVERVLGEGDMIPQGTDCVAAICREISVSSG